MHVLREHRTLRNFCRGGGKPTPPPPSIKTKKTHVGDLEKKVAKRPPHGEKVLPPPIRRKT